MTEVAPIPSGEPGADDGGNPNPDAGTLDDNGNPIIGDPAAPAPKLDADGNPIVGDPAPTDNWGDDWRQSYAGDDDKMQKRLERYASPKAALDALVSAQNKIASGDLKSTLPTDASDEEKATWRTENGIPETAKDYNIELPNGLVIGEADQPVVDGFLENAHKTNMHPSQVNDSLAWYFEAQENALAQQDEADDVSKQATEDELRLEWGGDYRRNVQLANNLLDGAPKGMKEQILGARLPTGEMMGNNPDALRWLSQMSREINPVATVVPGSGANAMQAIETEVAELKGLMGDRTSEYWKGPKAKANQARYLELITAQQKHG